MIRHILAVGVLLFSFTHATASEVVVVPDDVNPLGFIVFALICAVGVAWIGWYMWKAEQKRAQEEDTQSGK